MNNRSLVSVILPAYNEKDNVLPLILEVHKCIESRPHEILLVDDNSPDGTYQAALDLRLPYLKPILRTENRGLANSIKRGIEEAAGDIIVVMDSDFNHNPSYLPFMLDSLKYYDCVTASRFLYGGGMASAIRRIASWFFNIMVRLATGGAINDNLYGYFAIKSTVINKCDHAQIFWGYGDYFIRLLYFLQKMEISILQFPAINGQRLSGTGQSHLIKIFMQYSKELAILAMKRPKINVS
jgi:dolichol-phosphate mannosyltransferase